LYGRVIIPEAVVRELQAQRTPEVVRQWITSLPKWLQVRHIAVPPDPALAELDPGEHEAIALAETLRADALIIDDKIGRREAERRKLRVIGTVRVLDDAAEAGLVDLPKLRSASYAPARFLTRLTYVHSPKHAKFSTVREEELLKTQKLCERMARETREKRSVAVDVFSLQ
jgi:predicted nucleic acid-binding protein